MKWVLIVIILSSWDGSVKSEHMVASFDDRKTCEEEAIQLKNETHYARFICAQKFPGEDHAAGTKP